MQPDLYMRALEQIESSPPSLVVLDLSLPGIGGLDILRRVREREQRSGTFRLPIIVLSGLYAFYRERIRHRALAAESSGFPPDGL